jgi:hypothetical protein
MISKQQQRHNIKTWTARLCFLSRQVRRRMRRRERKIAEVERALDRGQALSLEKQKPHHKWPTILHKSEAFK